MATYTATRDYRSDHNGRLYVLSEGETVDLDDDTARWVNRDSPGTLRADEHACGECDFVGKNERSLAAHQRSHEDD